MAITYVTNINAVSCYPVQPHPDCVFNVSWVVSGTDGTYNAAAYGATDIPYVASDVYVPYADLTQDMVVSWVNKYGAEAVAQAQKTVADAIALNYKPNEPVSPPLPWNVPVAQTG